MSFLILKIAALFVTLVVASEVLRRIPVFIQALFWFLLPLCLLPLWIGNQREYHWDWFVLTKTFSVTLAAVWFALCASSLKLNSRWVAAVVWFILALNILEAVVKEFGAGQQVNAAAGVLLVILMCRKDLFRSIQVQKVSGHSEIAFGLDWPWIVAYTVWNASFVYSVYPQSMGAHIAVLSSAFLISLKHGPASWLFTRGLTLGVHLLLRNSFYGSYTAALDTRSWHTSNASFWFSVISLAVALGVAALRMVAMFRSRTGSPGAPAPAPQTPA